MNATLIHNPNAGGANNASSESLVAALNEAGLNAQHHPTDSEDDLGAALENPGDLVVVAGGDGTIRAVASRLAGKGVPMAMLPMGTANNLGGAFGLTGAPLELAAGFKQPVVRWLDLGRVRGPWGEDVFLEASGVGLFAATMAAYAPDDGKSPLRALSAIVQTVPGYEALPCTLTLDGTERHASLVLLEAMNTPATGPRLRLAPEADPGDGWLEVVAIEEDGRVGLSAYLTNLVAGRLDALPNVTVTRARQVRLEWRGSPLHLDAELRATDANTEPLWAEFRLDSGALEVWLPTLPSVTRPEGVGTSTVDTASAQAEVVT